jgi:hypothetical protein
LTIVRESTTFCKIDLIPLSREGGREGGAYSVASLRGLTIEVSCLKGYHRVCVTLLSPETKTDPVYLEFLIVNKVYVLSDSNRYLHVSFC